MILEAAVLSIRKDRSEEVQAAFQQARRIIASMPGQYQEWKRLLHHFYQPFPTVSHYTPVEGQAERQPPP